MLGLSALPNFFGFRGPERAKLKPGDSRATTQDAARQEISRAPWDHDKISQSVVRQGVRDIVWSEETPTVREARNMLSKNYLPLFRLTLENTRLLHPDSISALAQVLDLYVDPFSGQGRDLPFLPIDKKHAARIVELVKEHNGKINGESLACMRTLSEALLAHFPLNRVPTGELAKYFSTSTALPNDPTGQASITGALISSHPKDIIKLLISRSEADRLKLIEMLANSPNFNMSDFIYSELDWPGHIADSHMGTYLQMQSETNHRVS